MKTCLFISFLSASFVGFALGVLHQKTHAHDTARRPPTIKFHARQASLHGGTRDAWQSDEDDSNEADNNSEYEGSFSSGSSFTYSVGKPMKQQQSSSYSRPSSSGDNLARPILPKAPSSLSLSQLYLPLNSPPFRLQYPGPTKVPLPRQELLVNVNFLKDLDSINPRNPNALWEWVGVGSNTTYLANRAAFVKRPGRHNYNYSGHLDLISIPFSQYVNASDAAAQLSFFEGAIMPKQSFSLGPSQRLLVRLVFGCETINADQFPLPVAVSKNPWDDPRLVNCFLSIGSNNDTSFAVAVTNEGVWALYYRLNFSGTIPAGTQSFVTYRRIGARKSVKDLVDAAFQYDALRNEASFYVNGYRVWTINNVGTPPPNDGVSVIRLSNGTALQPVMLNTFQVSLGTAKFLDDLDPNNPSTNQAIAPITNGLGIYPASLTFADPAGSQGNETWGQGAIASLYQLKVVRADSLPIAATTTVVAPAVYG